MERLLTGRWRVGFNAIFRPWEVSCRSGSGFSGGMLKMGGFFETKTGFVNLTLGSERCIPISKP